MLKDVRDFEARLLEMASGDTVRKLSFTERRFLTFQTLSCSVAHNAYLSVDENRSFETSDDRLRRLARRPSFDGVDPKQLFYLLVCFTGCGTGGRVGAQQVSAAKFKYPHVGRSRDMDVA